MNIRTCDVGSFVFSFLFYNFCKQMIKKFSLGLKKCNLFIIFTTVCKQAQRNETGMHDRNETK